MTMTARRARLLQEIGVGPLWLRRGAGAADPAAAAIEPAAVDAPVAFDAPQEPALHPDIPPAPAAATTMTTAPDAEIAAMDWDELQAAVSGCVRCGLCRGRNNTVFGVGDPRAQWLFVGEGPGRNEDLRGEPFVGQAGKLLDNMLLAMDLRRGANAYIANIVKCRPTDATGRDRPPAAEEVAACMPYLQRQIALIRPSIIVALGKTAAVSLLGVDPDTPVSKLRGKVHQYAGLPLVVTYHPAYLLRNPADKRKVWADLCLALESHAGGAPA